MSSRKFTPQNRRLRQAQATTADVDGLEATLLANTLAGPLTIALRADWRASG